MPYNPNMPQPLRLTLPPIEEPSRTEFNDDGSPKMITVWKPDRPDGYHLWGPAITGDQEMLIRSQSDVIVARQGEDPQEEINPHKFRHLLLIEWIQKAQWDLTEPAQVGENAETGEPIMGEADIPLNEKTVMTKLHRFHRNYIQDELSKAYFPDMFSSADPNSTKTGKNGTTGQEGGSSSGSKKKGTSRELPSPSRESSAA